MVAWVANGSVYDDFRAVTVGTSLHGRTSTSGHAWFEYTAGYLWQVYDVGASEGHVAGSANGTFTRHAIDFGSADADVEVTLFPDAQSAGLSLRNGADSYYYVRLFGGTDVEIVRRAPFGVLTTLDSWSVSVSDPAVLRCVMSGNDFTVYFDGVELGTVTDSTYTGTRHGLFQRFGGDPDNTMFYAFNMHPPPVGGWMVGHHRIPIIV